MMLLKIGQMLTYLGRDQKAAILKTTFFRMSLISVPGTQLTTSQHRLGNDLVPNTRNEPNYSKIDSPGMVTSRRVPVDHGENSCRYTNNHIYCTQINMAYIFRIICAFRFSFIDIFGYVDVSMQRFKYVNINKCQTEDDVCLTFI